MAIRVSRKSLFEGSADVRFFLRPTLYSRPVEPREQTRGVSHLGKLAGCMMVISGPPHLEGNQINWI